MKNAIVLNPIDQLGAIRAQIGDLRVLEAQLVDQIIATNPPGRHSGDIFDATVKGSFTRSQTDWKTIAAKFEPSVQLVTAHTKTVDVRASVEAKGRSTAVKRPARVLEAG